MSMTKQQKLYACFGGVVGVCALALGWFLYSAYADYQAALEGDEEGTEGLSAAKEKNDKFYTQSKPFPSSDSIKQIESNKTVYAEWINRATVMAARGDCPPPPSDLDGTVFKQNLFEQVTRMQKYPGGVNGRICSDKFLFGFDQYLGEAGKTPEQLELMKLYAQYVTITNVVDLFRASGVLEIRKIERVEVKEDVENANARGGQRNRDGKGKAGQNSVALDPKHFDFNLEYVVRASSFVKVLNGLAKSQRFYVVSNLSFEQEGESLKARLERVESASSGGNSSSRDRRRGRGRDRSQESKEEIESGVVTNPETTPILVRMKLSAYDFGKNSAQVEAALAEAAATSSKKEGK